VIDSLRIHFGGRLNLPQPASDWLIDLWQVIQVFDDVHDGHAVGDEMPALWAALVTMPGNPFYLSNAAALQSAMATAILKWHAANRAEEQGQADEKSYVWRAAYYDVVLLVILLCHGQAVALDMAPVVMMMYGEPFADYRAEFPNA
jgi:hypothetical protein